MWTHQKWAEEDERDKVSNGHIEATFVGACICRLWVTGSATHARQHDLLPVLARWAPARLKTQRCKAKSRQTGAGERPPCHKNVLVNNTTWASKGGGKAEKFIRLVDQRRELSQSIVDTYLKSSIKPWKNVRKLLCLLMAVAGSSAMLPNTWKGSAFGQGIKWLRRYWLHLYHTVLLHYLACYIRYLHADDGVDEEQHGDQQDNVWESLKCRGRHRIRVRSI